MYSLTVAVAISTLFLFLLFSSYIGRLYSDCHLLSGVNILMTLIVQCLRPIWFIGVTTGVIASEEFDVFLKHFLLPHFEHLLLVGQISIEIFKCDRITMNSFFLLHLEFLTPCHEGIDERILDVHIRVMNIHFRRNGTSTSSR